MRLLLAAGLLTFAACSTSESAPPPVVSDDASVNDAAETSGSDAAETSADAGPRSDATPRPDATPACLTPACAVEREDAVAAKMEALRGTPGALLAFLRAFPKGGDLHNHLSGAIYAESWIEWGREDGLCVSSMTNAIVARGSCGNAGIEPLPTEDDDSGIDVLLRAWSMKDFVSTGVGSGHDHFFATFGKFGIAAGQNNGKMIAEARTRAADDRARYLELMNPFVNSAGTLADRLWMGAGNPTVADLAALHMAIVRDPSFAGIIRNGKTSTDGEETEAAFLLGCNTPAPQAGCAVTVRYLPTATRTRPAAYIFGQMIGAFELGKIDPRIVGMNLVSPEDDSVSFRDYAIQMEMIGYLRDTYEGQSPVKIALHAGELSSQTLPASRQNELTYHIRSALDVAKAHRIGHGVDVLHETDPDTLIADLAAADVLIEIGLSSNAQILEVEGNDHPLARYLAAGVPVALATDDQGVSRSSLTGEHVRAVTAQGVDYRALKKMARASLHYAFVEGQSLTNAVACASSRPGGTPEPACQTFLDANLKARLQWSLESDWVGFEESQR